jgi:hypothetical protein
MERLKRAGQFRAISICTTIFFLSSFCFFTPMAAAMESNNGNQLQEDIATIVKGSLPLYRFDEATVVSEMERMLSVTMGKEIEPQQSDDCAAAQLMFGSGIAMLLLASVLSEVVLEGECENEGCIGDFCVCVVDDPSHPLGGLSNIVRLVGVAMLGMGAVGSLTCVLDTTTTTTISN